jgi:hypothetical protein
MPETDDHLDDVPDFLDATKRPKTVPQPPKGPTIPAKAATVAEQKEGTSKMATTTTKKALRAVADKAVKENNVVKLPMGKKGVAKTAPKKAARSTARGAVKPAAKTKASAPAKPRAVPTTAIRPGSKLEIIANMLTRKSGATEAEMLAKLSTAAGKKWKRCLVTARRVAERLGKEFTYEKDPKGGPSRWFAR